MNKKLDRLVQENSLFRKAANSNRIEPVLEKTIDIRTTTDLPIIVELQYPNSSSLNNADYYYIVKETIKNPKDKALITSNEYEFVKVDLYSSKVEARLFYDEKRSTCLNNEDIAYELYIINNINFSLEMWNSTNDKKAEEGRRYLLIDNKGNEQIDGRSFESFALRASADKLSRNKNNSTEHTLYTKNSFLDGNYKD